MAMDNSEKTIKTLTLKVDDVSIVIRNGGSLVNFQVEYEGEEPRPGFLKCPPTGFIRNFREKFNSIGFVTLPEKEPIIL